MQKNIYLVVIIFLNGLSLIALPNQLAAIETSKSINLNIEADSDQNLNLGFDSFLQQAQTLANQAIQTEFNNFSELQRLNITVSLTRRGMVAPILTGSIERSQTNSQTWSRQIARSAELLGYVTIPPIAKRSAVVNSSQPSAYSAGFFKINRPSNRQSIPNNFPPGFPRNFSPNSQPQIGRPNLTPQNIAPRSANDKRDD